MEATAGFRILGFCETSEGEARVATRTVEDCGKEGKGAGRLEALRLEAGAGLCAYIAGLATAGAEEAGGVPAALLD